MGIIQTGKLKILIKSSAILNNAERQEWTGLLELMNDKQLLELEKILEGAEEDRKKAANAAVPAAIKPAVPAVQPKPASSPKPLQPPQVRKTATGIPQPGTGFSHIMNLPQSPMEGAKQAAVPPQKAQAPETKPESPAKKNFLQRLKFALSEKELPAPQKEKKPEARQQKPKAVEPLLPKKETQPDAMPKSAALAEKPTLTAKKPAPAVPLPPKPKPVVYKQVIGTKNVYYQHPAAPLGSPAPASVPAPAPAAQPDPIAATKLPEAAKPVEPGIKWPSPDLAINMQEPKPQTVAAGKLESPLQPAKPATPDVVPADRESKPASPVLPASPQSIISQIKAKPAPLFAAEPDTIKKEKPLPIGPSFPPQLKLSENLKTETNEKSPQQPKFFPGVDLPQMPANVKAPVFSRLKFKPARTQEAAIAQEPGAKEWAGKEAEVKTLQDIAYLTVPQFKSFSTSSLAQKLKALISKQGYHAVIFSLEKSPLFKVYVDTGLKILEERLDFNSLESDLKKTYLSKQEFEAFADLLQQIQAG
ncbi:MAG: hypothetical protein M1383_05505 [Patescibacteria group bacterium]|nr:hypothetical protein [Patescibacteria group bacterium]